MNMMVVAKKYDQYEKKQMVHFAVLTDKYEKMASRISVVQQYEIIPLDLVQLSAMREKSAVTHQHISYISHNVIHVVQQKQGRVQPTTQFNGFAINDDEGLEREADGTVQKIEIDGVNKEEEEEEEEVEGL